MDKSSSSMSSCIVGNPTSSISVSDTVWNETSAYWARFAHRKTPTLSTCEVAKKSFVGENERLVATLGVLNASINRPVGISNVRMTECRDAATSQRESGEKVYPVSLSRWGIQTKCITTNHIEDPSAEPFQFSHYPPCLDVHYPYDEVITYHSHTIRKFVGMFYPL